MISRLFLPLLLATSTADGKVTSTRVFEFPSCPPLASSHWPDRSRQGRTNSR